MEMMIVLAIVGIILTLGTAYFARMLPSARLNGSGRELSAMIRYAKMLSRTRPQPVLVLLDLDSRRYGIEGVGLKALPEGIVLKVHDAANGDMQNGIYHVRFHETGVVEGGSITLESGKRRLTIDLDPILGSVVVKD